MAKSPTDIRSLARGSTELALKTLAGVASNGQSESARVAAAVALLDRGWGKPVQSIDHSGVIETTSKEQRDAAVAAASRANS